MVADKAGKIFDDRRQKEDRRKETVEVKRDKRKSQRRKDSK